MRWGFESDYSRKISSVSVGGRGPPLGKTDDGH
jgi:hypothetical protein